MHSKTAHTAYFFKKISVYGIFSGVILFIANQFVSDYMITFVFSALAAAVFISSLCLFAFGLCLSLMEEAVASERQNSKSFMEKMTYLIWR